VTTREKETISGNSDALILSSFSLFKNRFN